MSEISIEVVTMSLSDNREEHFVRIKCDGRSVEINKYPGQYKNRALYERDMLRHVLLGHEEPDLMDFKYGDPVEEGHNQKPLKVQVHLDREKAQMLFRDATVSVHQLLNALMELQHSASVSINSVKTLAELLEAKKELKDALEVSLDD